MCRERRAACAAPRLVERQLQAPRPQVGVEHQRRALAMNRSSTSQGALGCQRSPSTGLSTASNPVCRSTARAMASVSSLRTGARARANGGKPEGATSPCRTGMRKGRLPVAASRSSTDLTSDTQYSSAVQPSPIPVGVKSTTVPWARHAARPPSWQRCCRRPRFPSRRTRRRSRAPVSTSPPAPWRLRRRPAGATETRADALGCVRLLGRSRKRRAKDAPSPLPLRSPRPPPKLGCSYPSPRQPARPKVDTPAGRGHPANAFRATTALAVPQRGPRPFRHRRMVSLLGSNSWAKRGRKRLCGRLEKASPITRVGAARASGPRANPLDDALARFF